MVGFTTEHIVAEADIRSVLEVESDRLDDRVVDGDVSVGLTLTPSLFTAVRDAKLRYESGKTGYETAVRQIELNVRKLFYNLIYTKESMALQKRNMETAKLRYENNRDKYNRGQLSELDLLQSQYAYESQRPAIESAEIAYQNSIASFKQVLGISQNEKIELSGG